MFPRCSQKFSYWNTLPAAPQLFMRAPMLTAAARSWAGRRWPQRGPHGGAAILDAGKGAAKTIERTLKPEVIFNTIAIIKLLQLNIVVSTQNVYHRKSFEVQDWP